MKRCPACKRVETDEALVFCRADGTRLVSDPSSLNSETGTAKLGTPSAAAEIETSILPHRTDAGLSRSTAPTGVLPAQSPATTGALAKPKQRRTIIAVVVIIIAAVAAAVAVIVNSYISRSRNAH